MLAPYVIKERNVVVLPDTPQFRPMAIGAEPRFLQVKGKPIIVVPNNPAINHVLYAAGHQVISPLYFSNYDWSFQTPFASQVETAGMIVSRRRSFVLNGMGTGKTLATLLAIDWLILHEYIRSAVVLAPLSTLKMVWHNEIMARMPRLRPTILHGSKEKRLKLLYDGTWNVAIVNHHGVSVIEDELAEMKFGMVVVDELSTYRTHTTKMWKAAHRLVHPAPFAVGLTGTPTPNSPTDAYGQTMMLSPERTPMSFKRFRYSVEVPVSEGVWIPRPNAKDKIYKLMQPAVRFRREDVLELKNIHHHTLSIDLSKQQSELIKALKKDMLAEYQQGKVVAANAAVLVGKLLQASAGAVYTSDKAVIDLKAIDRILAAESFIHHAEGKVIIFAAYRHLVGILASTLRKPPFNYGPEILELHREATQAQRNAIFTNFQDPNSKSRALIAHPKMMSHGLNLTAADTIVWYGPTMSTETYQQANARITRAGQDRVQLIYHLRSTAQEDKIYRTLVSNGNMQQAVLEMFESGFA